jgi:SAM-dependent methyltransferase
MLKRLARYGVRRLRAALNSDNNEAVLQHLVGQQVALSARADALGAGIQALAGTVNALKTRALDQAVQLNDVDLAKYAAIVQAGFARRSAEVRNPPPKVLAPRPQPHRQISYETALQQLRALRPELFDTWLGLYEYGAKGYYELPLEASCSTWTNEFAWAFKHYVDIFGHGTVLDLGCGPRIVPSYLSSFDPAAVCAIEPLELAYQPPFHVERTFAEFLPWDDASFDSLICGTSLDHVLSLTSTLEETRRVLRPGGLFINWLSSLDGAQPYDEWKAEPVDNFHLFQFNLEWALPLFDRYFEVVDVTRFRHVGASFEHVFLVLRKRTDTVRNLT